MRLRPLSVYRGNSSWFSCLAPAFLCQLVIDCLDDPYSKLAQASRRPSHPGTYPPKRDSPQRRQRTARIQFLQNSPVPTGPPRPHAPDHARETPPRHLHPAEPIHHRCLVRGLLRDRAGHEPAFRSRGRGDLRRHGARRPGRARCAPDPHAERVRRGIRLAVRHGVLWRRTGAGDVRMGAAGPRQAGLDRRLHLLRWRCAATGALQHQHRRRGQTLLSGPAQPGCGSPDRRHGMGWHRQ